jgi:hypothetical protein
VHLKERVLIPAGMEHATFDPREASEDRTWGLLQVGPNAGRTPDLLANDCAVSRTFMGIIASARDYGHLAEKLIARGDGLLSKSSISQMESERSALGTSVDESIGLGLFRVKWRGRLTHHHGGRAFGWESWFGYQPSEGLAVVVLGNGDGWDPDAFGYHVLDSFHGEAGAGEPDWSTPPEQWKQYVGTYEDKYGALKQMEFTWSSNKLFAKFLASGTTYQLYQNAGDNFVMSLPNGYFQGTFFASTGGTYTYFATRDGVAIRTATTTTFAPPEDAPSDGSGLPFRRPFFPHW